MHQSADELIIDILKSAIHGWNLELFKNILTQDQITFNQTQFNDLSNYLCKTNPLCIKEYRDLLKQKYKNSVIISVKEIINNSLDSKLY